MVWHLDREYKKKGKTQKNLSFDKKTIYFSKLYDKNLLTFYYYAFSQLEPNEYAAN